jgi:hypothetical protein
MVKEYRFLDQMLVPLYLPKERRWKLELYSADGEYIKTLEPTSKQKDWLERHPIQGLDANAEFHLVRQRKIGEIFAEAKGCAYVPRPHQRELYYALRRRLKLKS